MSKRARPDDDAERFIPGWLRESGVERRALLQLMGWMVAEDLCFVVASEVSGTHMADRFRHPVDPYSYGDTDDAVVVCGQCVQRCQCCSKIDTLLDDPDDVDSPHDAVCIRCMGRRTCRHRENVGDWPYYCHGCMQGCREPIERTDCGVLKHVCERCE